MERAVSVTVRLLAYVLCKPTNLFFQSFIATMSNSIQTSDTVSHQTHVLRQPTFFISSLLSAINVDLETWLKRVGHGGYE